MSFLNRIFGNNSAPERSEALSASRRRWVRFTPQEKEFIRDAFFNHVPAENVAAQLDRSVGSIHQQWHYLRVELKQSNPDIKKFRHPSLTLALKKYGQDILMLGGSPDETLRIVNERANVAKQEARDNANLRRLEGMRAAIAQMHADISAGKNRNEAIFDTLQSGIKGLTLERLGEEFDLTRERIRQIANKVAFERSMQQQIKMTEPLREAKRV